MATRPRHPAGDSLSSRSGGAVTDWSQIALAGDPDATGFHPSRAAIAQRYWPVIFAFIRQSGRGEEVASDLTQGFLADVLFSRALLEMATPERGRFRTLLLRAVTNYLRDDHRRGTAARRRPVQGLISLEQSGCTPADASLTPERAFVTAWVAMLMREAANRCQEECTRDGRDAEWHCLHGRVIRPALEGAPMASVSELEALTGIDSRASLAHLTAAGKRRFARHLLDRIGAASGDPDRTSDEVNDLLGLLKP